MKNTLFWFLGLLAIMLLGGVAFVGDPEDVRQSIFALSLAAMTLAVLAVGVAMLGREK